MLGREIVKALLARGYAVHGMDRTAPADWDSRYPFSEAPLQEWPGLKAALASVGSVIHAAAIANLDSVPEAEVFANNVAATSAIVYAAAEVRVRRFVYVSSQSALGFSRALSVIAPDYLPVDEDHRCHLAEGYGVSKLVGEQLCRLATYRYGMQTVSLRFPVIWAPENSERHTARRIGDETQAAKSMWSYVDLRDAARATVLALGGNPPPAAVLNISARWPFCQDDINGLIRKWYGPIDRKSAIGADAPVYAVQRAYEVLGFRAAYRWTADGIEEVGE